MSITCKITVEPVLFLYMLAVFMLFPALQDLIYTKVCLEDYSVRVCDDLYNPENQDALDTVQSASSHWLQGSSIMLAISSIFTAQFLGSWSDTYGRKIPLLLPPVGAMFASLLYIVMSEKLYHIPLSLILLASFINGICGGYTSCIMTCMSYVSQASSLQRRTARVGILESMIFIAGTLGPLLGGWVQKVGGRSSTFILIMSCHAAIIIYIIVCVHNILPRHPPAPDSWLQNMCTCKHLREGTLTVVKGRQENRRTYILWLLVAATVIMICTAGEMDTVYLFVRDKPIEWPFQKYAWYIALKYGLGGFTLLVFFPFCSKIPDMILALIGVVSKLGGLVLFGIAWEDVAIFVGAVVSMLNSWCLPTLRAALSKLVEPNEQGKMFAFIALLESTCGLVASGIFNSVYPATRGVFHGFVFIMAACLLILPVIILSWLYKALRQFSKYDSVELAEEAKEDSDELDPDMEPSPELQDDTTPSQNESELPSTNNMEAIQPAVVISSG